MRLAHCTAWPAATPGLPEGLSPAATPLARKPLGWVTVMVRLLAVADRSWCDSVDGQARRLGQAGHEVGALHGLAGRDTRVAGGLEPGGDAAGPEALGMGDGHGATPRCGRPVMVRLRGRTGPSSR